MEKNSLHPMNPLRNGYDFGKLGLCCPQLRSYIRQNPDGTDTIDFSNPRAVKLLNQALLKLYYQLDWNLPDKYLCPPIPGRLDYLLYLSDLLGRERGKQHDSKHPIRILDIGTGANCVYPILGVRQLGWTFVGSEIDPQAMESAHSILEANPSLSDSIELRLQHTPSQIFNEIVQASEIFDACICNPPFHSSKEESLRGTIRKNRNLHGKSKKDDTLNFGGLSHELWCEGGEKWFVSQMIQESQNFKNQFGWFTSLLSKKETLPYLYKQLHLVKAARTKTVEMNQGQKKSRFLAWSFSH